MHTVYVICLLIAFIAFSECIPYYNPWAIYGRPFNPHPGIFPQPRPRPPQVPCGPVCYIYCEYGNIPDWNGCPLCACRPRTCSIPKDVGPCYARILRFYFNFNTKRCEFFFWGGCEPNENNFASLRACRQTCGPRDIGYAHQQGK